MASLPTIGQATIAVRGAADMALTKKSKAIFDRIKRAGEASQLCLMECEEIGTKKKVPVLCVHWTEDGVHCFEPVARLFSGNPYNQVAPPGETAQRLI